MRKIFSLIAAVLFAGSMMAADVTITLENSKWSATAGAQSCTVSGVTVQCDNGVGNTQLRMYKNSTTTISVASTSVIKKIVFNCTAKGTSNYGPGNFTAQAGYSYADKVGTWVGEASSATFVASGAQVRAESIVVTVEDAPTVLKPAIVGDAQFFDEQEIAITCATEGAEIRYTLDGTDPTDASALYSKAIVITETTTIKAIAIKGADKSSIASASFKKAPSFATFEELVAATLDEHSLVEVAFEDIEIDSIYLNSQSKRFGIYFAINATVYEIYCNKDEIPAEWTVGGTVSGSIRGDWYSYKGVWELVPVAGDWKWENLTYAGSTTPSTPVEFDIVANQYVVYESDGYFDLFMYTSDTWSYTSGEGFSGEEAGTAVCLDLAYTDMADVTGSYSTEDGSFDASYSGIYTWDGVSSNLTTVNIASGTVTIAWKDESHSAYIVTYDIIGSDGKNYAGTAEVTPYEEEVPPTPDTEATITITNADLKDGLADYQAFIVSGTDADNVFVQLYFYDVTAIEGNFTEENLYDAYSKIDNIQVYSATITVVANADGSYTITGDLLCYNNTLYHLTMTVPAPASEGIEEILATGKAVKVVRGGQVVVLKADKAFNMNGQIVK